MKPSIVFLMYHELKLQGRRLCQSSPGYVRYVLSVSDFRTQLQMLRAGAWQGLSVGEAIEFPPPRSVAITFDDGCETDLLAAAPGLLEMGMGGTFYITTGFLGQRGYLSRTQLQELSNLGFEIGCHSRTHPYLPALDQAGLHREIVETKQCLEEVIGKPVEHFSCPGGRYDRRVIEFVRSAGYRTLATSRAKANGPSSDPYLLGRVAVLRGIDPFEFQEFCSGKRLWSLHLQDTFRNSARAILGNSFYDSIRESVLGNAS